MHCGMQQRTVERCNTSSATHVANYYGQEEKGSKEIEESTPINSARVEILKKKFYTSSRKEKPRLRSGFFCERASGARVWKNLEF
jgi:hypothetical protein